MSSCSSGSPISPPTDLPQQRRHPRRHLLRARIAQGQAVPRGLGLLRDYCAAQELPYDACGKVVVATHEGEVRAAAAPRRAGHSQRSAGSRWLSRAELTTVEPHVRGVAGLARPETAIADFAAVARAFAGEITAAGGEIRTGAGVARVQSNGHHATVELTNGSRIEADRVIVFAGPAGRPVGDRSRSAGQAAHRAVPRGVLATLPERVRTWCAA